MDSLPCSGKCNLWTFEILTLRDYHMSIWVPNTQCCHSITMLCYSETCILRSR